MVVASGSGRLKYIDRVLSDRVQGAMQAAEEEGFSVPESLSMIGFDDTLASLTRPRLTSVALPMYEIGKVAAHILFDRLLKHSTDKPKEIILSEKLIVRDSTGPPRHQNMKTSKD